MAKSHRLALLGAAPLFSDELHVGRPNVGDAAAFLRRAADVLQRRWLTNNGPYVQELERCIAEFLGVRNCVAMCNGTVALEIAIRATGLNGEVIVPSFTFVATAHALQWQEITPVFCDIDPATHNIDPERVKALITPRTTGILGVHAWGRACDVDSLQKIADAHGLTLLFDAAHAFGSADRSGRRVGTLGTAEVFSFHATKFFNTFEGGAVTTDDDGLAEKMRLMRNFGFAGVDRVISIGTNGKMSEICAAMGLVGLDSLRDFVTTNRANAERYASNLRCVPGLSVLDPEAHGRNNCQYIVVEVDQALAGLTRDELMTVLWAENVRARRYFYPGTHRMEPYRSYFPNAGLLLPETEALCERVLVLPTGTGVSGDDVDGVCQIIASALAQPAAVRRALAEAPVTGRETAVGHDGSP